MDMPHETVDAPSEDPAGDAAAEPGSAIEEIKPLTE